MQKSTLSYVMALLFALVFLMPRAINLHAFEHLSGDEDPISCEVCDIIIDTNQVDLYGGDLISFETPFNNSPNIYVTISSYETPLDKILQPTTFCNRPPPSL